MSQNITTLYNTLFETLQGLKDKTAPLDIDRAIAIKDVAQVIVNAAKVEVDHLRVAGGAGSGFIPVSAVDRSLPKPVVSTTTVPTAHGSSLVEQLEGATRTTHRMS